MNITRLCYFSCIIILCGCSPTAVVSNYQANVLARIISSNDCTNHNKIGQNKVSYQYRSIYSIKSKSFSKEELKMKIKKDAQDRILFYYKLPKGFDLTECITEEKLEWKKSYIDARKDSTDLREKEDETLKFEVKEI